MTPTTGAERLRKLGGTPQQVRSALGFYKLMAWFTGIFLILLVIEMVLKYGFDYEVVVAGINLSMGVLIIHGWGYVVYLVAGFRVWSMMRWELPKLLVIAAGGVVPFLSFWVERNVHRDAETELTVRSQF